jgi:hypothetical protein
MVGDTSRERVGAAGNKRDDGEGESIASPPTASPSARLLDQRLQIILIPRPSRRFDGHDRS